jgi:hypothetical protein
MDNILNKPHTEGGSMEKEKIKKDTKNAKAEDRSINKMPGFLKVLRPQTAVWVGATIVFAALFFASSVLDMKVNVTFGQSKSTGTVNSQVSSPGTAAPANGIASQVGGC